MDTVFVLPKGNAIYKLVILIRGRAINEFQRGEEKCRGLTR